MYEYVRNVSLQIAYVRRLEFLEFEICDGYCAMSSK